MPKKKKNDVIVEEILSKITLHVNTEINAGVRQRIAAAVSGGYDFADTLHNIFLDYGYPAQLSFFNFWNMYRRFGIARRVVELYPDQTWLDDPLVNGNERFNRELQVIIKNLGLWRRLKGLDTRQRVGRYAGMFMQVRDGKSPDTPIEGKLSGFNSLVRMIPLYESQLIVATTQDDPKQDDFGMPTMYQFSAGVSGSRDERAGASFQIHPSRIVIASEDSDNGGIYGIPVLESIYNSLMDLRKIIGGGGEGFYKNAAQSIVFDLKDAATANSNKALLDKFNEKYDDFAKNRFRRSMWTPGMESKVLNSNLMNPKEFAMNALLDISAGSNTPLTLLLGNQTGRLAGDQDTKGFLAQVQARRVDFGTDMVRSIVDWFLKWGIVPSSEYEVQWPDATAPSGKEKLDNANTMTDVNKKNFESGCSGTVFSEDEIREEAGFEMREEVEELPDETLVEEEMET